MNTANHSRYQKFVFLLAIFVFIAINSISIFIFNRSLHIHDEAAYNFQAKIFLLGRLYVPSPCAKEFFDFPHVINNGRWYSQYPPGFPALLAIGYILKAPWIINPLSAALTIILIFILGSELYNEKTGFLAALLASLSYWFLILSSTLISHAPHLFFCTLFLLFYVRSLRTPSLKNGMISGFGFFMAFLIRPYESVLFAVPPGIYLTLKFLKESKKYYKATLALASLALLAAGALMAYNHGTTGHPLKMGYIERYGPDHGIGFGKKGYTEVPHTFLRGANYVWANLVALHLHLLGWPISSLVGVIIFIILYFRRYLHQQARKEETLLIFMILSAFIGLLPYWGAGAFLGARMYFQLFSVLLLLTSAGILELIKRIENSKLKWFNLKFIGILIIISTLYGLFFRLPVFFRQTFEFASSDLNYFDSFRFQEKFKNTIEQLGLTEAIVLMKPLCLPRPYFPDSGWEAGFALNDVPLLKKTIIFGHYKPGNLNDLLTCFPKKKLYLFIYSGRKAMLFELRLNGQNLTTIPYKFPPKRKFDLAFIESPSKFFKPYSPEFADFLKQLDFLSPLDIDLKFLKDLASEAERNSDYLRASRYYEAILQLEPYHQNRFEIYKSLVPCYYKIKETSLAKRITEKIYGTSKSELDNIIPERGI